MVPAAINADTGHEGPLVLSSDEDSEIDSEAGTQSLSGYEASSDAESLPVDSPGKYIIPARRPRGLPVGDQQRSSTTSCSSEETNTPRRPQHARKKSSWMVDKNRVVGKVHTRQGTSESKQSPFIRGRVVTNVVSTCDPTPLLYYHAIKYY